MASPRTSERLCVRHQRHGIGEHAVAELHRDERQVEADADGEGRAEACGSVNMGAPVMVVIIVFMHVIVTEGAVGAHGKLRGFGKPTLRCRDRLS